MEKTKKVSKGSKEKIKKASKGSKMKSVMSRNGISRSGDEPAQQTGPKPQTATLRDSISRSGDKPAQQTEPKPLKRSKKLKKNLQASINASLVRESLSVNKNLGGGELSGLVERNVKIPEVDTISEIFGDIDLESGPKASEVNDEDFQMKWIFDSISLKY